MRRRLHKSSVPSLIALGALFFAVGGTAIAARHYLITSTSQIKPNVLKQLRGASGAAGSQGPAGPQGPVGPQGPAGPSTLSVLSEVKSPFEFVAAEHVGSAVATCPAGQHAVSGGGFALFGAGGLSLSEMSTDHQSWQVLGINEAGISGEIQAKVECAGAGQAVAARSNVRAHARAVTEVRELAAQLEQKFITGGAKRG